MTCRLPQPLRERRLVRRSSFTALLVLLAALSGAIAAASAQVVDTTGNYLQRMDRDGDGRVSLDEYLAWMSYAFDARDLDHDGVLSAAELPGGRGKPISRVQHQAILTARFRKQDSNGDGYLSARELAAPPQ
ncbi:EF-hand domain-containing protein [Xanthomonas translucens]|uniref:Calcium-dependent protein kinase 21 n=3 Tax=Xanthomonas campestris pv. translucens TaxID=343 RepID=A0A109HFD4_XANCT|nr:EF-hand domain-containing protein [Xanthomonas translucens]KTF41278.1 calcium-dependent protein kinase 21 [Xanthomonas translucens pv. translucens]KWV10751.1 calcium-dependent protein kinase 21 [Xanthomonas translucens]KWV11191.1 calcium-dependent protein kinase 21 [Xanthomonas translucens]MCC8446239.1 EF-hand domain-containing protein [Xanthomonas translucens pv. translucens]MCS3360323.1 EF-hand domain-containing protein [Xanthomonas translucens pv. translucens]